MKFLQFSQNGFLCLFGNQAEKLTWNERESWSNRGFIKVHGSLWTYGCKLSYFSGHQWPPLGKEMACFSGPKHDVIWSSLMQKDTSQFTSNCYIDRVQVWIGLQHLHPSGSLVPQAICLWISCRFGMDMSHVEVATERDPNGKAANLICRIFYTWLKGLCWPWAMWFV